MLRVLPIGELPSPFGPWQIAQLLLKRLFPAASSAAAKPPRARVRNSAARSRMFLSILKSIWSAQIKEHHNKRDASPSCSVLIRKAETSAPGSNDFEYLDTDVHRAVHCSEVAPRI